MNKKLIIAISFFISTASLATEYQVSKQGNDANSGSTNSPFKTISAAARVAQPGDTITVHQGVYRERINPPRGGSSGNKRIVYRAALNDEVSIKGSEIIEGWQKVQNDAWVVSIPNSFFGDFNPYNDLIKGDWFVPLGREHHTGAVYLNGHWLTEAVKKEHVLQSIGETASAYDPRSHQVLMNVAWFRPAVQSKDFPKVSGGAFTTQAGVGRTSSSEGGECAAWIHPNDWVRYEKIDFGNQCTKMEFRIASATRGGIIEIRLNEPEGDLLGSCSAQNTDGWQSWASVTAKIKAVSGIQTICLVFKARPIENPPDVRLWCAEVNESTTTIWAQFKDVDPNKSLVEINVRQTVFYPEKPGINYITVSGFNLMHAATPWSPPTAEQIGLIGVHWSKGWIIENNDISYSVCTGLTLGKHSDKYDNTSANSAEGYVKTIERATAMGWSKENIGFHIVRNNHISHCEQAGIVGSMGPVFCKVKGNTIHDIHIRRLFTGAEMAGIKFHGAVDTEISGNHIYRTNRGIWLDWMTQGTRVTGNLLYDNEPSEDLFVEVNHGPFLVDNNILLSPRSLLVNSQGGAYVHNLIAGRVHVVVGEKRLTPYLKEHSTEVAGLAPNKSGDERFYNNIFINKGLYEYDQVTLPVFMSGNIFVKGAKPSKYDTNLLEQPDFDPELKLSEKSGNVYLQFNVNKAFTQHQCQLVTTDLLGRAKIPDLLYVQPDGSHYQIDTDYFGNMRDVKNPSAGPFNIEKTGEVILKVR